MPYPLTLSELFFLIADVPPAVPLFCAALDGLTEKYGYCPGHPTPMRYGPRYIHRSDGTAKLLQCRHRKVIMQRLDR
jgi:hypothetical protein